MNPRLLALAALLCGCASHQAARQEEHNPDPFESFNRKIYAFNDAADRYVGKPVAEGYRKATPTALRTGGSHFLDNLRYPITIVNDLLQGKVRQGGADIARMAVNSTVGLMGLFDPASDIGLAEHDEDFGQTFNVWGLPQGPYLMVPIFGPYTASSAAGDLAGTQVSPLVQLPQGNAAWVFWGWYLLDERYRLLGLDEEVRKAFDPYVFVRDSYLQNRLYKIYDGHPPEEELAPEDEPEEPEAAGE